MSDLTLYNYWRSSSSHRVRIALSLKGATYRYVPIDLLGDQQSADAYKALNPTGYVPCLVIDGVAYQESVAIIELLEEKIPTPRLYPADAHGRARVRAFVEVINSGIQPLQNRNVTLFLSTDADVQKQWLVHFVGRGLASLEAIMQGYEREGVRGPYAYGDTPTAADVFLVPQVVSAERFKVDMTAYPRVRRAFDAAMELEAFQRSAPDKQPDAVHR